MLWHLLADVQWWMMQPPLIPDPAPAPPPGKLVEGTNTMLSWMKWGGLIGAVFALVLSGAMMAVGRRNRNNMAVEGAVGIPWVVAGIVTILASASIVGFLLD